MNEQTKTESREKIFDKELSFLVRQIMEICTAKDIPSLLSFQLDTNSVGQMLALHTNFPDETLESFKVAGRILEGKLAVMGIDTTEAANLGFADGIITQYKKHAETCETCKAKIELYVSQGKNLLELLEAEGIDVSEDKLLEFNHEPESALQALFKAS